jgi:hypothetical protein
LEAKVIEDDSKKRSLEGHIVKALRLGDVKKALRLLVSAPLADKGPETVAALRKLHPSGLSQSPLPLRLRLGGRLTWLGPPCAPSGQVLLRAFLATLLFTSSSVSPFSLGPFLVPWLRQ